MTNSVGPTAEKDAGLFGSPARDADISDDGLYRYRLTRTWNPAIQRLTFVMLNPSTADANNDDPTIRRCIGFASAMGWGGIVVLNLYAFRATKPADLWKASDPVGPENDKWLQRALTAAWLDQTRVIAAWGAHAKPERVAAVRAMPHADYLEALGVTKDGAPRHPLYLPASARPEPWPTRVLAPGDRSES